MKKYFYLIFAIFVVSLSGCKDESSTLTQTDIDSELQKQIIGAWTSYGNSHTTVYYANLTFIDSTFIAVDNIRYKLIFVANGNYKIKDSILFKTNITFSDIDSNSLNGNGYYFLYSSKRIKFLNNSYKEYPVDVFEPVNENKNELWGSWSEIVWAFIFRINEFSYIGRMKIIYEFDKVSMQTFYWLEYIDKIPVYTTEKNSNNIKYNPPFLDISGAGDPLVEVKFKNNKMLFLYDYEPSYFYSKL